MGTERSRFRLGIIYPGGGAEQDYYRFAERFQDVVCYLVFSQKANARHSHSLPALRETAKVKYLERAARRLVPLQPDAVLWACTSGSFVVGRAGAEDQVRAIRAIVGVPASSTSLSYVHALRMMKVRRVAIAATYPPAATRAFARFLFEFGIQTCNLRAYGLRNGDLSSRLERQDVISLARSADTTEAQALLIPDTALPCFGILDELQTLFRKPVLAANQVTMWEGLRLAGFPAGRESELFQRVR